MRCWRSWTARPRSRSSRATALNAAARETRVLQIRGGILDGQQIGEDDVKSLATLPPTDVLRGQLVGAVTGPLMTVVGLFTAPLRDLVNVLDARIKQLEEQGETVEAPPAEEPPTEEAPAAEASAEPTAEEVTPEAPAEEAPTEEPKPETTSDEEASAEADQASAEPKAE
jgi:hypothetical protein